jgi:hypothetical protein
MKQRIVTGFLATALTALTFAAQAQTYGYPNNNGIYVSPYSQPNVISPYTARPPVLPTYNIFEPARIERAQPTVPYSPPSSSSLGTMQQIEQDAYVLFGRR